MTNQEIDNLIKNSEKERNDFYILLPKFGWIIAGVCVIAALLSSDHESFLVTAIMVAIISFFGTVAGKAEMKRRDELKTFSIWNHLISYQLFGGELSGPTRDLCDKIEEIYKSDPIQTILPLRQAVRLIDTHYRQHERLQIIENHLSKLLSLQESLGGKLTQLQGLGESNPQGKRNLEQVNDDLEALRHVHGQIRASCTRLETIVLGVQKAAQSRQLHHELEGLNAQMPGSTTATEPAFEAESLEEIERQIGREIETYLRLERETEEHLR